MASRIVRNVSRVIAAIVIAGPAVQAALPTAPGTGPNGFQEAIDRYLALRHRIELTLPPLVPSDDAVAIRGAIEVRAAHLREARRDAREGDIFSGTVQEGFRKRIGRVLDAWPDLVASIIDDSAGAAFPLVGGRFQWTTATPTPAVVLAVLPPLPESLQYRFVGTTLVLVDIDASLIIDVLPDAISGNALPRADEPFDHTGLAPYVTAS